MVLEWRKLYEAFNETSCTHPIIMYILLMQSRSTGETVMNLTDPPQYQSRALALSPSNLFLLAVSEPIVNDSYVHRKALTVSTRVCIFCITPVEG